MKILIIEDEKLLADSLKVLLESKGFKVECVYDGESGAEYAELGIYDLLILDVMMPKMNGYQVARSVRSRRCGTPILMLTARSGLEDRIEGLNAGADYYLTKPFENDVLMAYVNKNLQQTFSTVETVIMLGKYTFDTFHNTISGENFETFDIPPTGSKILEVLARSKAPYMKATDLRDDVYDGDTDIEIETLRRNIDRLNYTFRANGHDNIIAYHPERKIYELVCK